MPEQQSGRSAFTIHELARDLLKEADGGDGGGGGGSSSSSSTSSGSSSEKARDLARAVLLTEEPKR